MVSLLRRPLKNKGSSLIAPRITMRAARLCGLRDLPFDPELTRAFSPFFGLKVRFQIDLQYRTAWHHPARHHD
jgi:hypothetical protein